MARNAKSEPLVELDLNNPIFQSTWESLEPTEQEKAFATFGENHAIDLEPGLPRQGIEVGKDS